MLENRRGRTARQETKVGHQTHLELAPGIARLIPLFVIARLMKSAEAISGTKSRRKGFLHAAKKGEGEILRPDKSVLAMTRCEELRMIKTKAAAITTEIRKKFRSR